jgi:hypothetical protein
VAGSTQAPKSSQPLSGIRTPSKASPRVWISRLSRSGRMSAFPSSAQQSRAYLNDLAAKTCSRRWGAIGAHCSRHPDPRVRRALDRHERHCQKACSGKCPRRRSRQPRSTCSRSICALRPNQSGVQAGFVPNGANMGIGIILDCIRPIVAGSPQRKQATKPLPQIDPQVIVACKNRNPSFGGGANMQPGRRANPSNTMEAPPETQKRS